MCAWVQGRKSQLRSNYNRESTGFLSVRVRGAAVSSEIRKDGKERRNIGTNWVPLGSVVN